MDHAKYNQSLPIIPTLLACHINVMYYKIFWSGVYIITITLYIYIFLVIYIYIYLEGCPHYYDHHIISLGGRIIIIICNSRWAYGVLLYEMLVGQPPFDGKVDFLKKKKLDQDVLFIIWMPDHTSKIEWNEKNYENLSHIRWRRGGIVCSHYRPHGKHWIFIFSLNLRIFYPFIGFYFNLICFTQVTCFFQYSASQ